MLETAGNMLNHLYFHPKWNSTSFENYHLKVYVAEVGALLEFWHI